MNCNLSITIADKIEAYIKLHIVDYVYNHDDVSLMYDDKFQLVVENWNFDFKKPTFEELETITIVKKCPKTCINCLVKRVEQLESV